MYKICKTCKRRFIPKDDSPTRPAKFCSRKCIRNKTQFKKGHKIRLGLRPPKYAWDNKNSKKTRFKKGHTFGFRKGHVPWNKNKDFGSVEHLAKRISWLTLYRKWKLAVKRGDGFKCIQCNSRKQLNVDHYPISLVQLIKDYKIESPQESKKVKKFWDTKNGRTLCISCHKQTLNYGRNFVQKM